MGQSLNLLGGAAVLGMRAAGLAFPPRRLRSRVGVSRRRALVSSLTFAVVGLILDTATYVGVLILLRGLPLPNLSEELDFIVGWSTLFTAFALTRYVQWLAVLRWGFRVEREYLSRLARFGVLYTFVLDAVTFVIVRPSGLFWG
jgi:hypothetical protein